MIHRKHPNEIELLFHMLRCFTQRYIPQFQFFKDFLEDVVAEVGLSSKLPSIKMLPLNIPFHGICFLLQTYSVEWKRKAFFKFVDVFRDQSWPKDLKAKVCRFCYCI